MRLQTTLPITNVSYLLPLMDVRAVKGAFVCSEDEVKAMIEDGTLEWGFNIASKSAERMEIRVLSVCVEAVKDEAGAKAKVPTHMAGVMKCIFGPYQAQLKGAFIQQVWNCGSDHINKLVDEKSLRGVPGRPGRNGSPVIAWDVVSEFLEARRII